MINRELLDRAQKHWANATSHRAFERNETVAHWVCVADGATFLGDDLVLAVPEDDGSDVFVLMSKTRWVTTVAARTQRLLNLTDDELTVLTSLPVSAASFTVLLDYVESADRPTDSVTTSS